MRARGIDYSHWQIMNPAAIKPGFEVDFAIQRYSYGANQDRRLKENRVYTLTVPMRGSYHYYYEAVKLQTQIDLYIKLNSENPVDFHVLDVERGYNTLTPQTPGKIREFYTALTSTFPTTPVVLYTNRDVYVGVFTASGATWHHQIPLWYAYYWEPPIPTGNPVIPGRGQGWQFWQYGICGKYGSTEDGRNYGCGSRELDLNVYNGTAEELHYWLKGNTTTPETDNLTQARALIQQAREQLQQAENLLK